MVYLKLKGTCVGCQAISDPFILSAILGGNYMADGLDSPAAIIKKASSFGALTCVMSLLLNLFVLLI